jgi:hypothetical protein
VIFASAARTSEGISRGLGFTAALQEVRVLALLKLILQQEF